MSTHREEETGGQKKALFNTHCVDARELHADVDHRNGDELPANAAVGEQATNRDRLDGGQGPLFLLHLLNLCLDVFLGAVPLQG